MATTVTYKGQTIATVDNDTKTLTTAGTWMEDDVTLVDVSSGGGGTDINAVAQRTLSGDIVLDTATTIGDRAFYTMPIESISSPTVTSINTQAFRYCTSLASVNLPNVTTFVSSGNYQFGGCTALTQAMFPKLSAWQSVTYSFQGCTNMVECDLGVVSGTVNNTFNGCTSLRKLILRRTSVCTTNWWNANVFGGIYQNPTESTIYVPQALISNYQTATNWSSAYAAGVTFSAIEGSAYEL